MSDVSAESHVGEPHVDEAQPARSRSSAEVVAGYLAALSIFASVIAVAWHPLRLIIPAVILGLVAAGMGGRQNRLARAAVMIAALAFFLGMAIAVAGSRPLF
jgi:hypothetical protein